MGDARAPARVLRVDPLNPEVGPIRIAAEYIRGGDIVAFPTETVYGLGADATNGAAVRKVFEAKGRPGDNPVIVHIASMEQLPAVARHVDERAFALADVYWPGPLTIIFPKSDLVSYEATGHRETVAVRMPAHPVALSLIMMSRRPIAAPSANVSGRPSPTSAAHVLADLGGKVDLILDGGETAFGVESTVVNLATDPPTILRPGPITPEELAGVIGEVSVAEVKPGDEELVAEAPGMKYPHYAPKAPLVLVLGSLNGMVDRISALGRTEAARGQKVGVLATEETKGMYPKDWVVVSVGTRFNPYSIAHNLYGALREFDLSKVDRIYAEGFDERGILLTVMNRLRKAAVETLGD
ncbi:MAG TPA: L-threonylcarbamoyladenylate synthase [Conexivisphaerales archaeon]|nr:L-threonylcarbamoyladenylate synthase [Conexivisphaerales archaeon]